MRSTTIWISGFVLFLLGVQCASAEVSIPDHQFTGYFDYNDIYTVVGAVRNTEDYTVIPTITIRIQDGDTIISESYILPTAQPSKDIPFKIKFAQVSSENPTLEEPLVTFVPATKSSIDVEVVYDMTLVRHSDGHTSGTIINNGDSSVHGIKVYALIHDKNGDVIDVGKNIENIESMEPGEKIEFSIYPDPLLATQVGYYSCFVIGDDMVIPISVLREGEKFEFRYESGAYFDEVKFDDGEKSLMLFSRNPWPSLVYANFEFPLEYETQKFNVYIDGEKINPLQSRDELGNWHVAFNLQPRSSNQILISGFEESESQIESNMYYLLGIIPVAAIIAVVFKIRKKKPL